MHDFLLFFQSYFAALFVLFVLFGALYLFSKNIMRPDLVGLLVMAVLMITGIVSIPEGVAGFSNPAVITVVMMFILSAALVRTGVADAMGRAIIWVGRGNIYLLTFAVMAAVSVMSAFMNNIAATMILLPAVMNVCRRTQVAPTRLLIPLSFGSLLGGMTTLIGTPPNLLVNMSLQNAGLEPLKMFDFFPVGGAVCLLAIIYFLLIGTRLLPDRQLPNVQELTERYQVKDYLCEVSMDDSCPWNHKSLGQIRLSDMKLTAARIVRGDVIVHFPSEIEVLQEGDLLTLEGNVEALMELRHIKGLRLQGDQKISGDVLAGKDIVLGEMVVPPRSHIIDKSLRELQFRTRYGLVVLALRRGAQLLKAKLIDEPLHPGDVLLVQGTMERLQNMTHDPAFFVVGRVSHPFRRKEKAWVAIAAMAAVVTLNLLGMHISLAAILGVLLMLVTRCLRPDEMYKDINWTVIFLIAGLMPLGTAMHNTGLVSGLVAGLESFGASPNPYVILAVFFILASAMTEVMSNAATAVLITPIAVEVCTLFGISPYPVAIGIAVAASSSFLTPIGHQANVMVYGMGGYRFGDFVRVGGPLNLLVIIFCLWWIPCIWPF